MKMKRWSSRLETGKRVVAEELNMEEEKEQEMGNREEEIEQPVENKEQKIEPVVEHREMEMEMEQDVGHREKVILIDDEDVIEEEQPTEVAGQRTGEHRYCPVGQLEEILATSGWMAVRSIGSDDEEEEGESTLIRRLRSRRRPLTEETAALEERQTIAPEATPQAEKTTAQEGERQVEVPAGEAETKEERLQRERKKRKGKRWQSQ